MEASGHIFIVGFMGAGKTSVARRLAMMTDLSLIDLDQRIQILQHRSISDIFELQGEQAFRKAETHALRTLSFEPRSFISCGGGVVETKQNWALMHNNGTVLFLDVDFEEAVKRISRPKTRPLLSDLDKAKNLYDRRKPLYYECADIVIKTKFSTIINVATECKNELTKEGIL